VLAPFFHPFIPSLAFFDFQIRSAESSI
jgi:hypothetical protein